jgi:hypothetical protein
MIQEARYCDVQNLTGYLIMPLLLTLATSMRWDQFWNVLRRTPNLNH